MTERLKNQLDTFEEAIANNLDNAIKNTKESVLSLINDNPAFKTEISNWYRELCKTYDIDIYSDLRITGNEINKHLEQF